jgi:hypothetical protein
MRAAVTFTIAVLTLAILGGCAPGPGGAAITGEVYRAGTSTPVVGATVTALPSGASSVTGSSGSFSIGGADGTTQVRVTAAGYATRTVSVASVPTSLRIGLSYVGSGDVQGTVRNAQGTPIAGATVSIGQSTATTDALGRFDLFGVPAGVQAITVTATGFDDLVQQVKITDGELTVVNLQLDGSGAF